MSAAGWGNSGLPRDDSTAAGASKSVARQLFGGPGSVTEKGDSPHRFLLFNTGPRASGEGKSESGRRPRTRSGSSTGSHQRRHGGSTGGARSRHESIHTGDGSIDRQTLDTSSASIRSFVERLNRKQVDELVGSAIGGIWERKDKQNEVPYQNGAVKKEEDKEALRPEQHAGLDLHDDEDVHIDTSDWHLVDYKPDENDNLTDEVLVRTIQVANPSNPYEGTDREGEHTDQFPDVNQHIVAVAPFGGNVAMAANPNRMSEMKQASDYQKIQIFTGTGIKVGSCLPSDQALESKILHLGWTADEYVVAIYENGMVEIFHGLTGRRLKNVCTSLFKEQRRTEGVTVTLTQCTTSLNALVAVSEARILPPTQDKQAQVYRSTYEYTLHMISDLSKAPETMVHIPVGTQQRGAGDGAATAESPNLVFGRDDCKDLGLTSGELPSGLGIFDAFHVQRRSPCFIIATTSRQLVFLRSDPSGTSKLTIEHNPVKLGGVVKMMAVGPEGDEVAMFDESGELVVLDVKTNSISPVETDVKELPNQLLWCSDAGIALVYSGEIHLLGSQQKAILHYKEAFGSGKNSTGLVARGSVAAVQEIDCIRVITNWTHDIIEPVSESLKSMSYAVGPGPLLVQAVNAFQNGNPKCDECIRDLRKEQKLSTAIANCLEIAAQEWDGSNQKMFLRAASYGKSFDVNFSPTRFVNTAKRLRILNTIRKPDIGVCLTDKQLSAMQESALVARLAARGHFKIALQLCDYIGYPRGPVIEQWACEKAKAQQPAFSAFEFCKSLVNQVKRLTKQNLTTIKRAENIPSLIGASINTLSADSASHGVSFANIASAAHEANNKGLATELLNYEGKPAQQVPLLLQMGELDVALSKACISCNSSLIHMALSKIKSELTGDGFDRSGLNAYLKMVARHPRAAQLLHKYARQCDHNLLRQIRMQWNLFSELGLAQVRSGLNIAEGGVYESARQLRGHSGQEDSDSSDDEGAAANDPFSRTGSKSTRRNLSGGRQSRKERMAAAHEMWSRGSQAKPPLGHKGLGAYAKLAVEHVQLLEYQEKYATGSNSSVGSNLSLYDSMSALVGQGDDRKALELKQAFKESDIRFCFITIKSLAENGRWAEYKEYSNKKKLPLEPSAFVEVALDHAAPTSIISTLVERVQDNAERAKFYLKMGDEKIDQAADAAIKSKDISLVHQVYDKAQSRTIKRKCEEFLEAYG